MRALSCDTVVLKSVKRKSINTIETEYSFKDFEDSFTVIWSNYDYLADEVTANYKPQEWVISDNNKLACYISNIIHDGFDANREELLIYMQLQKHFNELNLAEYLHGLGAVSVHIDDFGQYALLKDADGNAYDVVMQLPENKKLPSTPSVNDQLITCSKLHSFIYKYAKSVAYNAYSGDSNDTRLSNLSFAHGARILSYKPAKPSDVTDVKCDWESLAEYIEERGVLLAIDEYSDRVFFEVCSDKEDVRYIPTNFDDFYLAKLGGEYADIYI